MDPSSFTHNHPLHEALPLATEFNVSSVSASREHLRLSYDRLDISQVRKAILYSLVTTTDFDVTESTCKPISPAPFLPQDDPTDEPKSITPVGVDLDNTTVSENPPVLSQGDAAICMTLMTRFIEHFTPILFTPAATPHMACTDVFADTWMPLVIQPALDNDGVYKPLETLERMKSIDWAKKGLCLSCVLEKREEWTEAQRTVWRLIDGWLKHLPPPETAS